MAVSVETTRLSADGLAAATAIQSRAFFADPLFEFVFPESEMRRQRLPWVMQIGITLGLQNGEVHTTAPEMLGHAVWLPPGRTDIGPERLTAAGFVDPARHMGDEACERFGAFMEQMSTAHEHLVPEDHWYLMILGTDPPHQGRGIGSTLIRPVLTRADGERRRCYLETAKERNLPFYRKHGFEVVGEDDVAGGGPHVWLMVREPR